MNRKKCLKCKKTIVGKGKFGICKRCYADILNKKTIALIIITVGGIAKAIKLLKEIK